MYDLNINFSLLFMKLSDIIIAYQQVFSSEIKLDDVVYRILIGELINQHSAYQYFV